MKNFGEIPNGNPKNETVMNEHNNSIGRACGKEKKTKTTDDCEECCKKEFSSGGL